MKITIFSKNLIAFLIDFFFISITAVLGFYLRTSLRMFDYPASYLLLQALYFIGISCITSVAFGLNRGIWRYFNFDYLLEVIKVVTIAMLMFIVAVKCDSRLDHFPRSIFLIDWLLLITFLACPRLLYRLILEKYQSTTSIIKSRVLLIGITPSSEAFLSTINQKSGYNYKIIGILDTKQNTGRKLNGVPILGSFKNLAKVVETLTEKNQRPNRIIIADDASISGNLQELLKFSENHSIPISRIPKFAATSVVPKNFNLETIPIEDLLNRPQKVLNYPLMQKMIENEVVLITGAGGSIGSEIARQVARLAPKKIILLDFAEFLLYEIEQEFCLKFADLDFTIELCDVKDTKQLEAIFANHKPKIVFHAAALKHVPMLEKHPINAATTNIFGTKLTLDLAIKYDCKKFVLISTDKTVKATSFMGATKKIAEIYAQAVAPKNTNITIVRFGNVLGSNGSVVPLFEKQIALGGPLTITDLETTRYFMTIKEAVGLVIQAAALNNNSTKTYVLDMGEPVKIYDIALHMITLAGLKLNEDIKVKVIGLRPGENLHEELVTADSKLSPTAHKDILECDLVKVPLAKLKTKLSKLAQACDESDAVAVREIVAKLIKLT
jgi:FlaA1/EpsC-like NDP-sugar epimerase